MSRRARKSARRPPNRITAQSQAAIFTARCVPFRQLPGVKSEKTRRSIAGFYESDPRALILVSHPLFSSYMLCRSLYMSLFVFLYPSISLSLVLSFSDSKIRLREKCPGINFAAESRRVSSCINFIFRSAISARIRTRAIFA